MKHITFSVFLLCVQLSLSAQVKFERDFNLSPGNSYYYEWVEIGGKMYFSANDGYFGYELWQFDPATELATRLTDLRKQGGNSNPQDIVEYEGKIYFVAATDEHGAQLFFFDPQTWAVERVSLMQGDDFNPRASAVHDGKLFFTAETDNRKNLWSYDVSTGDFSEILAPPSGDPFNFNPQNKFEHNGRLYFQGRRPDYSIVLWSYDDGTGTFTHEPTQFDGNVNFWPIDNYVKCNGEMLLNIRTGASAKWHHFDQAQDSLIFLSNDNSQVVRGSACLQDQFWYVTSGEINHYDPLTGQMGTLEDLLSAVPDHPFSIKAIGGNLFILGSSFSDPNSIWKYNPAGNTIQEFPASAAVETYMATLMEQGDKYYFFAKKGVEKEVFKYDLPSDHLEMIADINQTTGAGFSHNILNLFHEYDGRMYFNAVDSLSYQSTVWFKDLASGQFFSLTNMLQGDRRPFLYSQTAELGGRLYFSGERGNNGNFRQLVSYKTGEDSLRWHGTLTQIATPFTPFIYDLMRYEDGLIFSAVTDYDVDIKQRLFRFDTTSQTSTILPGLEQMNGNAHFIHQGRLYFSGAPEDESFVSNYYEYDLTSGNLVFLEADSLIDGTSGIFPLGDEIAYVTRPMGSGNQFSIQLYNPATGNKTEVLLPGYSKMSIKAKATFQGKIWFTNTYYSDTLFYLDPATGLCDVALDLQPFGVEASRPMLAFDSKLYFSGYTQADGAELFEYDPATGDVRLYADLNPGGGSSDPEDFAVVGNRLYFTANDGWRGHELWSLANCFAVSLSAVPDSLGQNAGQINLDVQGGTAPFTFSWNNGATTQDLTGLASGFYEATVTDAAGCEATVFTVLEGGLAVGTDELKNMPQVRVYPNPASDVLRIELSEMQGEISASLFNYSGVKLQEQTIRSASENMDVSGLPGGIYFLVVRGEGRGVFAEKIVVHR